MNDKQIREFIKSKQVVYFHDDSAMNAGYYPGVCIARDLKIKRVAILIEDRVKDRNLLLVDYRSVFETSAEAKKIFVVHQIRAHRLFAAAIAAKYDLTSS